MNPVDVDVLVVGGGPAGLEAAYQLARVTHRRVLVVDREPELGGIPRHCHHTGFGWFDLRRVLTGPSYARRRVELARRAGVELARETTAIDWVSRNALVLSSPRGLSAVRANAVVLATGCRERPRAARLVPGTRPQGVLTTGSLQQLVHLHGLRAGRRAVVIGAEHVSFSAVHTLTQSGTEVAAMVTDLPAHQTFAPFRWLTASLAGVPIHCEYEVTGILGERRVEAVRIASLATGASWEIPCDTVVFTGDWIPDHELARAGGVTIDPGTRGPAVDVALRTTVEGVFAAGNLLHGAEMADVAALEGRHVARTVHRYLEDGAWHNEERIPITVEKPLLWAFPNAIAQRGWSPPEDRFVLRTAEFVDDATVEVHQGARVLHRQRYRRLVPNRAIHLPAGWLADVEPGSGPVRLLC
jgi:thioredoxin reductase